MWQDEILEEIHQIREQHAKSFDYNFEEIFADWKRKQATNGRELVSLEPKCQSKDGLEMTSQK